MSDASKTICELIRLRELVKSSKVQRCTCSGFVIQYEGRCCCERAHNTHTAGKALSDAIESLASPDRTVKPFERTAILADPNTMRINISFQEREDYEAALMFFDMGDSPDETAR